MIIFRFDEATLLHLVAASLPLPQNGFVESFHGRLRDECLNREQLWTLTEARVVIEDYRCQYNHYRPHSKLGYQSPKRFAATTQSVPSPAPVAPRAPYVAGGQTKANNITNLRLTLLLTRNGGSTHVDAQDGLNTESLRKCPDSVILAAQHPRW